MRFPRMHIAASVQNRILNAVDEIAPAVEMTEPPIVSNPAAQGEAIDQAVSTPPPAIPAPDDSTTAIAANAVDGGTAAEAVGGMAALEAL